MANVGPTAVLQLVLGHCLANVRTPTCNGVLPTTPNITQRWPNDCLLSLYILNPRLVHCSQPIPEIIHTKKSFVNYQVFFLTIMGIYMLQHDVEIKKNI